MGRLGVQERVEFEAIRQAAYRGLDGVALRSAVAERLAGYLDADAYCAMQLDAQVHLPVHALTVGWPVAAYEPLLTKALLASPAADPGTALATGHRAVLAGALLGTTPFTADAYYQWHILPFGYRHEVQLFGVADGRGQALITFTRAAPKGDFAPRQLRLLEAVAPHLGAGMRAAHIRARLDGGRRGEAGVIVLDVGGDVEVCDHIGEQWLRATADARPGGEWLMALDVARRMVDAAIDGDGPPPALRVTDPVTGGQQRIRGERRHGADGRPRTVLLIEPAVTGDAASVLGGLGLSARESQVVAALLRGDSVDAIASRLGRSPHTVVEHRRRAFAKLGVSSRRELAVRLLASGWLDPTQHGPPAVPPRGD